MHRRRFMQSSAIVPFLSHSISRGQDSFSKEAVGVEMPVKPTTLGIDRVLTELGDALAGRVAPANLTELEHRKREVRSALFRSLGLDPFPERTQLNIQMLARLERRGYTVEKIVYESRPNFYVPANVYVPADLQERAPAVVCPTGHWMKTGKEDPVHVQPRCIGLAQRGYIALAYDPIG